METSIDVKTPDKELVRLHVGRSYSDKGPSIDVIVHFPDRKNELGAPIYEHWAIFPDDEAGFKQAVDEMHRLGRMITTDGIPSQFLEDH